MKYIPPFEINNAMLDYVFQIEEKIKLINKKDIFLKKPILRKSNKIKSIYSSLSIEANSLNLNQMMDCINGKKVIGPENEIKEVKNAFEAYKLIHRINPYSLDDLKKLHSTMMRDLISDAGKYRKGEEGVFDGDNCIFIAPLSGMLETLMTDLFLWIKESDVHPLIVSCVFHYEFVFIHPFSDGNGRMARLWQNVILTNWNSIFEFIPIESEIKKYQNEYYNVINECHKNGNSNLFILFMLRMIYNVLEKLINEKSY